MPFIVGDEVIALFHLYGGKQCRAIKTVNMEQREDISAGVFLPPAAQQGTVLRLPGERLRPLMDAGLLEMGTTPQPRHLG